MPFTGMPTGTGKSKSPDSSEDGDGAGFDSAWREATTVARTRIREKSDHDIAEGFQLFDQSRQIAKGHLIRPIG